MAKADTNAERFLELRRKVERLQRDKDRAEGARDQYLSRLLSQFGCKSFQEGEKLLKQMKKERQEREEMFAEKLTRFERKWSEVLK